MFAAGRNLDEDDNTKAEAAKMQKEYENLKDSTKKEQPSTATSQSTVQTRWPQETLLALGSVISEQCFRVVLWLEWANLHILPVSVGFTLLQSPVMDFVPAFISVRAGLGSQTPSMIRKTKR